MEPPRRRLGRNQRAPYRSGRTGDVAVAPNGKVWCRKDPKWKSNPKLALLLKKAFYSPDERQVRSSLDELRATTRPLNPYSTSMFVSYLRPRGMWQQILLLIKDMLASKLLAAREMPMRRLRAGHYTEKPKEEVEYMARLGANEAIAACGDASQWQQALALLKHVRASGLRLNAAEWNACANSVEEGGRWNFALSMMKDMRIAEMEPDMVSGRQLLSNSAGLDQSWRCVLRAFQEVREWGLEVDVPAYTFVMNGCRAPPGWQSGLDALRELRMQGLEPDSLTLSTAMRLCSVEQKETMSVGQRTRWDLALSVMEAHFVRRVHADSAHGAVFQPSSDAYRHMMRSCVASHQWAVSLQLLDDCAAEEHLASTLSQDTVPYRLAIEACGRAQQAAKAMDLMRIAAREVREMDAPLVTAIFNALESRAANCSLSGESAALWARGVELLEWMRRNRAETNLVTKERAIATCQLCAGSSPVPALLADLRRDASNVLSRGGGSRRMRADIWPVETLEHEGCLDVRLARAVHRDSGLLAPLELARAHGTVDGLFKTFLKVAAPVARMRGLNSFLASAVLAQLGLQPPQLCTPAAWTGTARGSLRFAVHATGTDPKRFVGLESVSVWISYNVSDASCGSAWRVPACRGRVVGPVPSDSNYALASRNALLTLLELLCERRRRSFRDRRPSERPEAVSAGRRSLRARRPSERPEAEPKDDRDPNGFYPGDRVSAWYHRDNQWYEAVVLYQKGEGVWDVSWDEPDEGEQITSVSRIRLVRRGPVGHPEIKTVPLGLGDEVWALFLEDQRWYDAVISKMPQDDGGEYTVKWHDPDGAPRTAKLKRRNMLLKLRKL